MLIRKKKASAEVKQKRNVKCFHENSPQCDADGHPYIGYIKNGEFVPNQETIDAILEGEKIIAAYLAGEDV
jgi:hypothetical protein